MGPPSPSRNGHPDEQMRIKWINQSSTRTRSRGCEPVSIGPRNAPLLLLCLGPSLGPSTYISPSHICFDHPLLSAPCPTCTVLGYLVMFFFQCKQTYAKVESWRRYQGRYRQTRQQTRVTVPVTACPVMMIDDPVIHLIAY